MLLQEEGNVELSAVPHANWTFSVSVRAETLHFGATVRRVRRIAPWAAEGRTRLAARTECDVLRPPANRRDHPGPSPSMPQLTSSHRPRATNRPRPPLTLPLNAAVGRPARPRATKPAAPSNSTLASAGSLAQARTPPAKRGGACSRYHENARRQSRSRPIYRERSRSGPAAGSAGISRCSFRGILERPGVRRRERAGRRERVRARCARRLAPCRSSRPQAIPKEKAVRCPRPTAAGSGPRSRRRRTRRPPRRREARCGNQLPGQRTGVHAEATRRARASAP